MAEEGLIAEIEEEFEELEEEFEGGSEGKPVYNKKFQGDMSGTSDPYEEEDEEADSEYLASASKVPGVPQKAKWFSATKKTLAEKKEARKKSAAKKAKASDGKDDLSDDDAQAEQQSKKKGAKGGDADADNKKNKRTGAGAGDEDEAEGLDDSDYAADEDDEDDTGDEEASDDEVEGPHAAEDKFFQDKAKSMSKDLDEIAKTGKEAKKHKEILGGIRKSLKRPNSLHGPNPTARAVIEAAKSGDDERLDKSLQRYGRSQDDQSDDPQDLSRDPKKLQEVRSNHRKAIRHS